MVVLIQTWSTDLDGWELGVPPIIQNGHLHRWKISPWRVHHGVMVMLMRFLLNFPKIPQKRFGGHLLLNSLQIQSVQKLGSSGCGSKAIVCMGSCPNQNYLVQFCDAGHRLKGLTQTPKWFSNAAFGREIVCLFQVWETCAKKCT